jgi:GTP cyclohydrolase I
VRYSHDDSSKQAACSHPGKTGSNGHSHYNPETEPTHLLHCVEAQSAIEEAVRTILINVGEDPERDGLVNTPGRVARMYAELLEGYTQDLPSLVNGAMFDVEYGEGEMVVVANIEYNSLCEHHMLPFTGKAHVAYIPTDKVVGLSKIPRIVDMLPGACRCRSA